MLQQKSEQLLQGRDVKMTWKTAISHCLLLKSNDTARKERLVWVSFARDARFSSNWFGFWPTETESKVESDPKTHCASTRGLRMGPSHTASRTLTHNF